MITFLGFLFYYMGQEGSNIQPNMHILLLPVLIVLMGGIALGSGIMISSMTTKYRDLNMFIGVGVTLLMYATPIMYPTSAIPEAYKPFLVWNPIAPIIETFRYSFTGYGSFTWSGLTYSFIFMLASLFLGLLLFNRTEKTFMDTV
jgi:lipopolysaccharide transport system permease protein